MTPKFYINIGRELGSGGFEVGKELARILDINIYDKELVYLASKESGISKEFFEKADEKRSQKLFGGFFGLNFSTIFSDVSSSSILDGSELFKIQSDIIRRMASQGSAVFMGRCADYILRDEPNSLNVFITAPIADRIARVKANKVTKGVEEMSDEQIAELLERGDSKRSEYYNYFTYKTWGAAKSYNLCLDSSLLGIDGCVAVIEEIITKKFLK